MSQLFINYKNGVEFSPFYHYGMFSLPFHFAPSYYCVEVRINGKRLQTKDFTPNGWDNVVMPITQYNSFSQWNRGMYNQTIKRLLHVTDSTRYISRLSQEDFDAWYRLRILHLLNIKDSLSDVRYKIIPYKFQNGILTK